MPPRNVGMLRYAAGAGRSRAQRLIKITSDGAVVLVMVAGNGPNVHTAPAVRSVGSGCQANDDPECQILPPPFRRSRARRESITSRQIG
jgi:hypothetical protein